MEKQLGKIVRIGYGLVFVMSEGKEGKIFPFLFNDIEGYRGEELKELKRFSPKGIQEGILVWFSTTSDDDIVVSVSPLVFRDIER